MRAFVDEFFSPLATLVEAHPVALRGAWSSSLRKEYASAIQLGTGEGPFVDVVDAVWSGGFESVEPVAGIAVMCTATQVWWAKSKPASANPAVRLSLTSFATDPAVGATFTGTFRGAFLPGVPVKADVARCILGSEAVTGRLSFVAEAGDAAFAVLLLPAAIVRVGRNRLWRLRDEVASTLPSGLRELLTRRRSGELWRS